MITLRADNRTLEGSGVYAYLVNNVVSGVSQLAISNTEGFAVDDMVIVGSFGEEDAEIRRISAIDSDNSILTLVNTDGTSTALLFAHAESVKISKIPFDEIRFYWTAAAGDITDETPTFGTSNPLTGWVSIEPASIYTLYEDSSNSTGFGWFVFRNSVTLESSQTSNPIPYGGFDLNTVGAVFADFDSLLNSNELRLVTMNDRFAWFNEALSVIRSKLNLSNSEYFTSDSTTLTINSGTAEYQLASDFSDMVEITDSTSSKTPIPFMSITNAMSYTGNVTHYYIRGRYIGIVPTPGESTTYKYRYRSRATRVTSLSTYIDLPDNAFYSIKDWMLYRAYMKFNNPLAKEYYGAFNNSVNFFIQSSVKRDAELATWGIADSANV